MVNVNDFRRWVSTLSAAERIAPRSSKRRVDALSTWAYFVVLISAILISGIYTVLPGADNEEHWIGHADAASVADLARNIAEGRGPYVNHIWILVDGGMPGSEVTVPVSYWSLYQGYFLSLFFRLFGSTQETVMLTLWLVRALIASLGFGLTHWLVGQRFIAFVVGMVLLLHPLMLEVNHNYFDSYLTLVLFSGLVTLLFAIRSDSKVAFVLAGVAMGVAGAIKVSGFMLPVFFLCYLVICSKRRQRLKQASLVVLGILIGLAPLIHYQKVHFDQLSPVPPASGKISYANVVIFNTGDYNRGFYDPTIRHDQYVLTRTQNLQRMAGNLGLEALVRPSGPNDRGGPAKWFEGRFLDALRSGEIVPLWMMPFLLIAFVDLIRDAWKRKRIPDEPRAILVFFALMFTLGGLALATQLHTETRYWNFLFPVTLVASAVAFAARGFPKVLLGVVFIILLSTIGSHQENFRYYPISESYRKAKALVPEGAVVMTNNPWEFSYHTRRPAVMLPYTDSREAIVSLAKRYGVEYLVIPDRDSRHPYYNGVRDGDPFPDYLERVHWEKNLAIGRFAYADPPGF